MDDGEVPKEICRDVPGEFKISQVIGTYFKCKSSTDGRLVIRKDEDALYRLLGTGWMNLRLWERFIWRKI